MTDEPLLTAAERIKTDGPRVAAMIELLRRNADEIEAPRYGRVELPFGDQRVSVVLSPEPKRMGEIRVACGDPSACLA